MPLYTICLIHGEPQYDSLPVAKILDYPLEKEDYKPYAQAILALSDQGLFLRLWAFEALPSPVSALEAVVNLAPDTSGLYLSVILLADGNSHFRLLEQGRPAASFSQKGLPLPSCRRFDGEDLQGVYWGGSLLLDKALLQSVYGRYAPAVGQRITGNLYKLSEDPASPHYGSLYPARFPRDPYGGDSMGEFSLLEF